MVSFDLHRRDHFHFYPVIQGLLDIHSILRHFLILPGHIRDDLTNVIEVVNDSRRQELLESYLPESGVIALEGELLRREVHLYELFDIAASEMSELGEQIID